MLRLVIPSSGRPNKQTTLRYMPKELYSQVTVVVQMKECEQYERAFRGKYPVQLSCLPSDITTLSPTRQWIIDNIEDQYICLIDDDLRFYMRGREDNSLYLQYVETQEDHVGMFRDMENYLISGGVHCGISAREGNNRIEKDYLLNKRMMRCVAYDVKAVRNLGVRFDRLACKTDFDVTLQLLRMGKANRVSFFYAQGQVGGSNSAGGCSAYRTDDVMTRAAIELELLHPEFVTVVEKETKTAWGGGVRTDVRIQWKKAFESSI